MRAREWGRYGPRSASGFVQAATADAGASAFSRMDGMGWPDGSAAKLRPRQAGRNYSGSLGGLRG
jgi:hypothetical protein